MSKLKNYLLLMSLSLCGMIANAYDFESGGIYYNILSSKDKTAEVTYKNSDYNSYSGQVEIPINVSSNGVEYKITKIGNNAFMNSSELKSVTIPNSVNAIGEKAFYNCGIISVTVGTGVTTIGSGAFNSCNQLYKVIMLPNSVPSGLSNAISSLKGRVTYVSNSNYSDSKLGTIVQYPYLGSLFVVDGVKFVPVSPSDRTCDIIDYDYSRSIQDLTIFDKVTYQGIEMTINKIQNRAFYLAENIKNVKIDFNGSIGDYAFAECNKLEKVELGEGISNIGQGCFLNNSNLTSVDLPSNIQILSNNTFDGCTSLSSIDLPESLTSIGDYCFNGCISVTKMQLPPELTVLNRYVLAGTGISEIIVSEKITEIQDRAFDGCKNLTKIEFSDGKNELKIGSYILNNAPIEEVYIGRPLYFDRVNTKGYSPFYEQKKLQKVTISDNVSYLFNYEFAGCSSLKEIIIPKSVIYIDSYAFQGCSSLNEITIPASVGYIGNNAFQGCSMLSKIIMEDGFYGLILEYDDKTLEGMFKDCPLTEIYLGRDLYYMVDYRYINPQYSPFKNNKTLKKVTISNFPTFIDHYAFSDCSSIEYFIIGESVQVIGEKAFSGCSSLTTLVAEPVLPPNCWDQALDDVNKWSCKLYVPEDAIDAYKNATQWKDFFFFEKLDIIDRLLYIQTANALFCVSFSDSPSIRFPEEGQLELSYNEGSYSWTFDDFDRWYFGREYLIPEAEIDDIVDVESDILIQFDYNIVKVSSLEPMPVSVYDISGKILSHTEGNVEIDMTKYSAGIYIIRVGNKSVKFLKK